MYILNQDNREVVNTDYFAKFKLMNKPECELIVAWPHVGGLDPITLGRYKNSQEAKGVLIELCTALRNDEPFFEMPMSEFIAPEQHIYDARTKRRGGS